MARNSITREDIVHLFGDISEHKIAEILATGATKADLEGAAMWLNQQDDVMGEARKSLMGKVKSVYNILVRGEEFTDDRDR